MCGGPWEWEYGLVRSWVEQARGWKDSEARLLDVDRRVNRVIVGPWTKDEFNEKYWALWSRNSGTRSQAGTSTSWLFCFSSVPFWPKRMQPGDIRFLVEVFVLTHLTLLSSAWAHSHSVLTCGEILRLWLGSQELMVRRALCFKVHLILNYCY